VHLRKMSAPAISEKDRTYKNPVYPHSFPDPFVLKHGRDYFAYCTGIHDDGNVFGTLHSTDLVHWEEIGGAMRKLDTDAPFYWAPEVTFSSGRFYLYYSVGNETLMEIRLAVSDGPTGFSDVGSTLTHQEFAIDPHVFIDDDGQRYLFYATDFLEHTHIGTGTVVDRMLDWDELEGSPRPVTRAMYDWQIYDPARKEKGGVRWHTVEGPFVLKRKDRYFEMFSGGNWQNTSYGVSFATSDDVLADPEWQQFSDGENTLPILRTTPDIIVGPGHNSVVRGPNGRELYCVYHRWTDAGRVMAIDRMDFAGDRIFVAGPTDTPQPAPFTAKLVESSKCISAFADLPSSFLCEFAATGDSDSPAGFELFAGPEKIFDYFPEAADSSTDRPLFSVYTLDVDGRHLKVSIDGVAMRHLRGLLSERPDNLKIFGHANERISVTEGFEELFEHNTDPVENGWKVSGEVHVENGKLTLRPSENEGLLGRECVSGAFDLAVNLRLDVPDSNAEFGLKTVSANGGEWRFGYSSGKLCIDGLRVEIPSLSSEIGAFAITRQLRILALADTTQFYLDGDLVGTGETLDGVSKFEIYCRNTGLVLDMVRLTRI